MKTGRVSFRVWMLIKLSTLFKTPTLGYFIFASLLRKNLKLITQNLGLQLELKFHVLIKEGCT
jgi:hypothetical protein